MANTITQAEVLAAIQTKKDPELDRDAVTLGWIRDLTIANGNVGFRLVLPVPVFPSKREFADLLDKTISSLPNVKSVAITVESEIPVSPVIPDKPAVPGIKHIMAVSSGKGGVG